MAQSHRAFAGWVRSHLAQLATASFGFVVLLEFAYLVYSNLVQTRDHIGFDASGDFQLARLMGEQLSLHPDGWAPRTTLEMTLPTSAAGLLYALTGELLLSYAIVNIVVAALIGLVIVAIIRRLGGSWPVATIALAILYAPHYAAVNSIQINDLGYYAMLFANSATYGPRVLAFAACILAALWLEQSTRRVWQSVIIWGAIPLYSLLTGISDGPTFGAYFFGAYGLYLVIRYLAEQDHRAIPWRKLVWLAVNGALLLLGLLIARRILDFAGRSDAVHLVSGGDYFANLGNAVAGFVGLLGGYPMDSGSVGLLSRLGVAILANQAIAVTLIVLAALAFRRRTTSLGPIAVEVERDGATRWALLLVGLPGALQFVLFAVTASAYGGYFELRYMLMPFVVVLVLAAVALQRLLRRNVITGVALVVAWVMLLGTGVQGAIGYSTSTVPQLREDAAVLASAEYASIPVVYGDDDFATTVRSVAVLVPEKSFATFGDFGEDTMDVGFINWGNPVECQERGSCQGPTLLISSEAEFEAYPTWLRAAYEKSTNLPSGAVLYRSDRNVISEHGD